MEALIDPPTSTITVSQCVAPEDLVRGDYIAIAKTGTEFPSFFWCDEGFSLPRESVVRVWWTGSSLNSAPLKVRDVCLPFILVTNYKKKCSQLDLRGVQLLKLDPTYARHVRKRLRKEESAAKLPTL